MKISKLNLRNLFKKGLKPTEEAFYNLFDSYHHKDELIPQESVSGLKTALANKLDVGAQETLVNSFNEAVAAVQSAYNGIATTTTTPPATGSFWYRVTTAGTYTNFLSGGSPVVVSEGDFFDGLDNYEVFLEVKDNVAMKRVKKISLSAVKDNTENFLNLKDFTEFALNVDDGWVNTFETNIQHKIIDFIAIKGFGTFELLRVYEDFTFDTIQNIYLNVDGINYFNVNIELKRGERLGIRCLSTGTSKVYYSKDYNVKTKDLTSGASGVITMAYWYNVRDLNTEEEIQRKSYLSSINESSVLDSLYIRPEILKNGFLNVSVNIKSEGKLRLMVLKRSGTIFKVKSFVDVQAKQGVNSYRTKLKADGTGDEYFATFGQILGYAGTGGNGFYERPGYNYEETFTTADQTSLPLKFAILIDYYDEVASEINYPDLKPYGTLKFRKTTGNFQNIPSVYFSGRWFDKVVGGENTVASINQGAEIFAKVKNTTTVNALFTIVTQSGNTPYISVSIDGGSWNRMMITPNLQIASGLSLNEHTIRIVVSGLMEHEPKWANGIGIAFKGISVDGGGITFPIKPENRYGIFFGDSITEGINVLGVTANSDSNCAEQAYPFVASNILDVAPLIVGFGGSGLINGGSGGVPKAVNVIDWTISGVQENAQEPDFIVINHGTNDSGTPAATYKGALIEFLNRIKIKYPAIPIFVMQPFLGYYGASIVDVIISYNNVFYIDTTGWGVTYSDSAHPNTAGGKVAGEKLANAIKNIMGENFFIK